MSKQKARVRSQATESKRRSRSRRKSVIVIGLILSLGMTSLILAGWGSLRKSFSPLVPVPTPTPSLAASNPSKEYIYAGGKLVATEEPTLAAPPPAPTNFEAKAEPTLSTSPVHLTWALPAGSFDHYQIESKLHKDDQQWSVVTSSLANTATSYDDNSASANTAYLYRVCAVTGSQTTCTAPDLTTTTYFQDYPFQSGQTPIRAQHFLDLMSAVNAVRVLAGLSPITWSTNNNPAPAVGGRIYPSHLNDLRGGLKDALSALGLGTPQYEAPDPIVSGTQVKATQLRQLQDLVR